MRRERIKDRRRRRLVKEYEIRRGSMKGLLKSDLIENRIKEKIKEELKKMPVDSAKERVRNRCVETGRGRGVIRGIKLSRMEVRRIFKRI